MKATLAAFLIFSVISVALAHEWAQPGKCVQFYSLNNGKRLAALDSKHDRDRRYAGTVGGAGDYWIVTKDERYADHYKIKHRDNGEELFESEQNYHGNYIFTWVPKTLINDGGASWNIMRAGNGNYKLKNKKFNNCLWQAESKISAFEACDNNDYLWKLVVYPCSANKG
uniref:Putative 17.2 kDa salivary peptide n=1 Tax=Culex quinquefasciatus TaxID=7176 RepID=Q6TS26_CULQU|nr:putative 17.2 kDa salivary peptide [Culex quinquefasciatus]